MAIPSDGELSAGMSWPPPLAKAVVRATNQLSRAVGFERPVDGLYVTGVLRRTQAMRTAEVLSTKVLYRGPTQRLSRRVRGS
jgi:hypothetical protein